MGADAEKTIRREEKRWLRGHGKAGESPCWFVIVFFLDAHDYTIPGPPA